MRGVRNTFFAGIFCLIPASIAYPAEIPLVEQSLALDSPDKAVDTFIKLHRAGDFESLWFALDPALRANFYRTVVSQFELGSFVAPGANSSVVWDKALPVLAEYAPNPEKPTSIVDSFAYFAGFMAAARELHLDAFDLSGEMKRVEPSARQPASGQTQLLVFQSPTAGRVEFELRQAPSRRWRVFGVAANIGTPKEIRWTGRER